MTVAALTEIPASQPADTARMEGREIPGFYFDPEARKYFRIISSHAAPNGAKFTKEKVKRETDEGKKRKRLESNQHQRQQQLIKRSPALHSPFLAGISHNRATGLQTPAQSRDAVTQAFAQSLRPAKSFKLSDIPPGFGHFGTLSLEAADIGNSRAGPLCGWLRDGSLELFEPFKTGTPCPGLGRLFPATYQGSQNRLCSIDSSPLGFRACVYNGHNGTGTVSFEDHLQDSYQYCSQQFVLPGTRITSVTFNRLVNDLQAIVSTSRGLSLLGVENEVHWQLQNAMPYPELLSSDWMSPTVAAAGARNGNIYLWDIRSQGHAMRVRHDGVASGLRRAGNPSQFVVCGIIDKLMMYDLRMPRMTNSNKPESRSSDMHRTPSKKSRRRERFSHKPPTTTPAMTFDYSNAYYDEGFGFDVCGNTNLVAAAEDTGGFSLYSLLTGDKIDGTPQLGDHGPKPVQNHIKCLKFQKDPACLPSLLALTSTGVVEYT